MSPEKQRVALAEACGWKLINPNEEDGLELYRPPDPRKRLRMAGELPDYLNDLNSVHDAENFIMFHSSHCTVERYIDFLVEEGGDIWNLDAKQKSRALLKSIGKWEES